MAEKAIAPVGGKGGRARVLIHVLRRIASHGSLTIAQRRLHPHTHKIPAVGAALSAHLSVPPAPVPFPEARLSSPADTSQGTLVPTWSPKK